MPNLASRSLGLAIKALPAHWQAQHGYRPLLAETFTDPRRNNKNYITTHPPEKGCAPDLSLMARNSESDRRFKCFI